MVPSEISARMRAQYEWDRSDYTLRLGKSPFGQALELQMSLATATSCNNKQNGQYYATFMDLKMEGMARYTYRMTRFPIYLSSKS